MPRAPRGHRQTKRLPTLCIRRDTARVASLKTACSTTHWARYTDQPCRRKPSDFLGKNCAVPSQIVVAFRSAEIGGEFMCMLYAKVLILELFLIYKIIASGILELQ